MNAIAAPQLNLLPPAAASIEEIRTVLRTDIAAILRREVPGLNMVSQDKVYDRVMSDPTLLSQSLRLFRSRPDLFESTVTPQGGSFPRQDSDLLRCGRTLADAISLVVRACARRYFRIHLPAPKARPRPQPKVSTVQSLMIGLGLSKPPAAPKPVRPVSPGDRLFQAMRSLLRFEWQVPLIPVYAALPLELVKSMGDKLLDFRDPQKLQALADQRLTTLPSDGKLPLLLDDAKRLMTGQGDTINAEMLWRVAQEMRLAALFPQADTVAMRRMVSQIAATNPKVLKALMPVLGGDIRHFTLYLFVALDCFGPGRFRQVMGSDSQSWVIDGMAKRVAGEPKLTGTNEEMRDRIADWLSQTLNSIKQEEARASGTKVLGKA